jgi:hypothetical protein
MKRFLNILSGLIIPASLFLPGCLDIDVRTTVASDGSSERTISLQCSSRELPRGVFPSASDSSWVIEWKEVTDTASHFEYIARKKFSSPEDLVREYASRPDTGVVGIKISLQKRFEWFYTYLDYREAYVMHNDTGIIPVTQFMTPSEIERYVRGDKTEGLKNKVKQWDDRVIFERIFRNLIQETDRLQDTGIPSSLLMAKKEELFADMVRADSLKGKNSKQGADSTKKKSDGTTDFLQGLESVLKTKAVYRLGPAIDRIIPSLEINNRPHPDSWKSSLQMPGLLVETNSDVVEGNLLTWKFGSDQIHVGEYQMNASSRVANVWAFIVTGFAGLLVAFFALRKVSRRR